jgi:uridine phosphorylase
LAGKAEKSFKTNLRLVRIGTCGALQPEINPGTPIISDFGLGFDNLAQFYDLPVFPEEEHLQGKIRHFFDDNGLPFPFYIFSGSGPLRTQFSNLGFSGITATCPGFYGPQGRSIRLKVNYHNFLETLKLFRLNGLGIQNFEMETSALFALSRGLDHDSCSINLALANRETGKFLNNYNAALDNMIQSVLDAWPDVEA